MIRDHLGPDRVKPGLAAINIISLRRWLPMGRKTKRESNHYQLQEMPTLIIQNGQKNAGRRRTVIVSWFLTGSALTREFAKQHRKPWIHLDFKELSISDAAARLLSWIERNNIRILNAAGASPGRQVRQRY